MPTRLTLWIAAVVAGVVAVPAGLEAQGREAALLAAERAASELSRDSGLTPAVVRAMDPAGVLLWPGAPVVAGSNPVRRLLESIPGGDSLRLVWQPLGIEISRDSMLGATWGVAVGTGRRIPTAPEIGRYIAAWRRQADRWSIVALLFIGIKPSLTTAPGGMSVSLPPATVSGPAWPFLSADLAFSRLAGDSGAAIAFERWASPDAKVFGGRGLLVQGPEAIGRGVAGDAVWRWYPVAGGASQGGDLGWTVGQAIIAPRQGEPWYSKYLTIWVRPPGAAIRFLTDGGSSRPPDPGGQGPRSEGLAP